MALGAMKNIVMHKVILRPGRKTHNSHPPIVTNETKGYLSDEIVINETKDFKSGFYLQ